MSIIQWPALVLILKSFEKSHGKKNFAPSTKAKLPRKGGFPFEPTHIQPWISSTFGSGASNFSSFLLLRGIWKVRERKRKEARKRR